MVKSRWEAGSKTDERRLKENRMFNKEEEVGGRGSQLKHCMEGAKVIPIANKTFEGSDGKVFNCLRSSIVGKQTHCLPCGSPEQTLCNFQLTLYSRWQSFTTIGTASFGHAHDKS